MLALGLSTITYCLPVVWLLNLCGVLVCGCVCFHAFMGAGAGCVRVCTRVCAHTCVRRPEVNFQRRSLGAVSLVF